MKQPSIVMGSILRLMRRLQLTRWLKALCIMVVFGLPVMYYGSRYMASCSTSHTAEFIQDLCAVYDRGEIAGNQCEKLCHGNQFTFLGCSNANTGKTVAMMQCLDCEHRQRHVRVVFKSKLQSMRDDWMADHGIHFSPEETTLSMLNRTKTVIGGLLNQRNIKIDISNHDDVLAHIWGQSFQVDVTKDGDKDYARAALQSILSLAIQEEYTTVVTSKSKDTSYVPRLYGTCGPAYLMEYTPSFSALGYVLYNRKEFGQFASLVPPMVSWADRTKAAIQLLNIMKHLENLDPPVFFCGLKSHNFGLNSDGDVTILDLDSFKYGVLWPPGHPCNTHRDCSDDNCFGKCNMTTNTCLQRPISNNLRNSCRYIFSSAYPALPVGLLRMPPSSIATELKQLLQECINLVNSGSTPWKSDEKMHHKLVTLLQSTL